MVNFISELSRRDFQRLLLGAAFIGSTYRTMANEPFIARDTTLSQLNNHFAVDLLQNLENQNSQQNQLVSPFSIESALLMTLEGARGNTAVEMGKTLGLPPTMQNRAEGSPWNLEAVRSSMQGLHAQLRRRDASKDKITKGKLDSLRRELDKANAAAQELMRSGKYSEVNVANKKAEQVAKQFNELAKTIDQYELRIANSVWIENSFDVNPGFAEKIRTFYAAVAENVDFKNAPEDQRERINEWVSEHTEQKIQQLIPRGGLPSSTRMVLANAVYFRGTWSEPFERSQTAPLPFYQQGKNEVAVPTMSKLVETGRYGAYNTDGKLFATPKMMREGAPPDQGYPKDGFQIIELPYNGDDLSMIVVLPSQRNGLASLIKALSSTKLDGWINQLAAREFMINLPKFKQEVTYDLEDVLKKQGMIAAFDPSSADFSGISSEGLYISKVKHKAFVEVNEEGTEAAAATVVMMAPTAAFRDVPFTPVFRADHPFLYIIRNRHTGLILFLGKVESIDL